jgi:ABC-type antimicrobial peptide transport system ATPase subunit
LLESAFRVNDQASEILVYEKMSLCHFYIGELEKAKYYLVKMTRGLIEPQNSEIRIIYRNLRQNY